MRIDFHAHILPGADHGSRDIESSIKQLTEAKKAGVDFIVATPHFYPDKHSVDFFLKRRGNAFEKLKPTLSELNIQCRLGAEVMLCEGLENLEGIEKLCIEGTKIMLLELPFRAINHRLISTVCNLQEMGIVPILAHINRYSVKSINSVMKFGTLAQLNAEAFFQMFGRRKAMHAVRDEVISAIGSDAHEDRMQCYGEFARALKKIGKENEAKIMKRSARLLNIK